MINTSDSTNSTEACDEQFSIQCAAALLDEFMSLNERRQSDDDAYWIAMNAKALQHMLEN